MSEPHYIIKQIMTDMSTYINPQHGYNTTPVIRHGRYTYDQLENELPVLCVSETAIDVNENFNGTGYGWINILIYGYARHDGYGDNETIIDLALDTYKFVNTDFTMTNDTEIMSKVDLIPGGRDIPVSLLTLDLRIKFDWSNLNLND